MRIRKKNLRFFIVFLLLISSSTGVFLNLLTVSYENLENSKMVSIDSFPKSSQESQAPFIYGFGGPSAIDPLDMWDLDSIDVLIQCAEPLVDYNYSDLNYPIIPKLATDWYWHSSTEISFKIRENVYFHDGTLLDANSVKWNFDRLIYFSNYSGTLVQNSTSWLALPASKYYTTNGTPIIDSVVVNSGYNLTFNLNTPFSPFLDLLTFSASYILSPTSTPKYRYLDMNSEKVVGTGPFVFEYYLSEYEVRFHAYEDYWGGKANIETLIFEIKEDRIQKDNALLDKTIDFVKDPFVTNYATIEADPELTLLDGGEDLCYFYLEFYGGPGDPILGNPWNFQILNSTWRRALSFSINYTNMWEDIIGGYGNPGCPAVPRQMPGYNSSLEGKMSQDNPFGGNYASNIKKAREYMQSMGYGEGWDTNYPGDDEFLWESASFRSIKVNQHFGSFTNDRINELLDSNWNLIGVDISITTREWGDYLNTGENSPWEMECSYTGWCSDSLDAYDMLDPLFNNDSVNCFSDINDPVLKSVLEIARAEVYNITVRRDIYKWIQSYVFDITRSENPSSYIHAPLWTYNTSYAFHNDLSGFEANPLERLYFYPCTWDREMPPIPGEFTLSCNADSPDTDGIFDLIWTTAENATNYTVYISSKPIIKITEMVIEIMDGITSLTYPLSGLTDGIYYLIVGANNEYGQRISNPISVNVTIPGDPHSLFDGLYLEYFFRGQGWEPINATSKYSSLTGDLYYVNETSEGEYWWDYGTYHINTSNRIVTNVQRNAQLNFNGTHTYKYIYTNTEIEDYYLMTINEDQEDHIFQVIDETTSFFPGLGMLRVWVLHDLSVPGTIAMFEKETGINVYSFIHNPWGSDYTITLNSTNAPLYILNLPDPFTLLSTAGSPDIDGEFDLVWSSSSGADNYSVYEYDKYITEINGSLSSLASEITDLTIPLSGYASGTYYFIVEAHNEDGDTLSDCIEIVVDLPLPGSFTLVSTAGSPDDDGEFDLVWESSSGADNYSVYEYNKYITELNGSLTSLGVGITDITLPLSEYTNGTYYFIVAAHNENGYTLSNCIKVEVAIPSTKEKKEPGIPGYNLYFVIAILGVTMIVLIKKLWKKTI
jgi:ABC-type transport system substrate-binding protein